MLNKLKTTLSVTAIYSLGNVVSKLIGIILLPLYTYKFQVSEYGVWAIFETSSLILVSVFAANLPTAMLRWCTTEKNAEREKSIVFTTFISILLVAIFLLVATYPLSGELSRLFWNSEKYTVLFKLLFVSVFFELINRHPVALIRLREKPTFYVIVTTLKLIIILGLNIYLIVEAGLGIESILISRIIGNVFFLIITSHFILSNFYLKFEKDILKQMLRYSLPLILTTLSNFALSQSDRFIIPLILDETALGIYSVGFRFASLINMLLIQSFSLGFLPIAFKMFGDKDAPRYFSKTFTYYSMSIIILSLSVSLFSKELVETFTLQEAYWEGQIYIPLICLGIIFRGFNQFFTLGFHYKKTTAVLGKLVFFSSAINIVGIILLLPVIGLFAAPVTLIISMIFLNISSYYFSNRLYQIKFEFKKVALLLCLGILIYCSTILFKELSFSVAVMLKILLILLFPVVLYPFNFYEKIEIQRLKELVGIKR